jgi:outer membrane protein OmpA-like peptidoglycan-associated protein
MPICLPFSGGATRRLLLVGMCLMAAATLAAPSPDPPEWYGVTGKGGRGDEPKATGLHVAFYRGINFEYIEHVRQEEQVNYQWAHPIYAQGLEGLEFSARWTGRLRAPVDGMYRLCLKVDDGARLWLAGRLLIDQWYKISNNSITLRVKPVTFTAEVHLKRGQYYDLKIEYFNYLGPGVIKLYWESPQTETEHFFGLITQRKRELVPAEFLSGPPEKPAVKPAPIAKKDRPAPARPALARREPAAAKPVAPKPAGRADVPAPTAAGNRREPVAPREPAVFDRLEAGKPVVLDQVLFEQSKYVLLPGSYAELDKLVNTLKKYPAMHILVAGHTENVGDPRLNQALSENRALVVTNYLVRNGIAENRIETRGYGGTRPLAGNATETDRARNRRVEFTVKNP